MTWATGFSLSLVEYEAVWRHLGLGAQPYPLVAPVGPPTGSDRLRVQQQIRRALTDRGLLHAGVLDGELEELLFLLDAHSVAVHSITGPARAIAASDGYSGVLAVLSDGQITLRPIRPTELALAAATVVPPCGPGSAGVVADRYEQLAVLVAGSIRSGSFGATSNTDGTGHPEEFVWFDLPEGRYLAAREGERLIVNPASDQDIIRHLRVLLGEPDPLLIDTPTPPLGLVVG